LNDDKRQIKILDRKYIRSIVNEVENIFEWSNKQRTMK
jgi:hypothetical protein